MTIIRFNEVDRSYELIDSDALVQGSSETLYIKVWFGTYDEIGNFTPNTSLVYDNTKSVGIIFTRPDGKHTWFLPFAPQMDGSFLTTFNHWSMLLSGVITLDVQIKTIGISTVDSFTRISFLVNEGTILDDEEFIFSQADYQALLDMIGSIVIEADTDIMVGTSRVYTETAPLSGLRVIDGVQLIAEDRVLVAGQGAELNGIYIAGESDWVREFVINKNHVVSIDEGDTFGGAMIKKLEDGTSKIVKKPERMKWRVM